MARVAAAGAAVGILAASGAGWAESRLDFLNDNLAIPESARFDAGAYTQSGVGLSFGVDMRLAYLSGQYAEAAERFEKAVVQYPYKSEIWVFLARAHFFGQAPGKARQTLYRAAAAMPDLDEDFWQPLVRGVEWEVRKRANQLHVQAGFYSRGQDDFLGLFRHYAFLQDWKAARDVIRAVDGRVRELDLKAESVTGDKRRLLREQAGQWEDLAGQLRDELAALGQQPEAAPARTDRQRAQILEEVRLLQLKIDFYQSEPMDFRRLFYDYLDLERPDRADSVRVALGRERRRLAVEIDATPSLQEKTLLEEKASALDALLQEMAGQLEEP